MNGYQGKFRTEKWTDNGNFNETFIWGPKINKRLGIKFK